MGKTNFKNQKMINMTHKKNNNVQNVYTKNSVTTMNSPKNEVEKVDNIGPISSSIAKGVIFQRGDSKKSPAKENNSKAATTPTPTPDSTETMGSNFISKTIMSADGSNSSDTQKDPLAPGLVHTHKTPPS